MKPSKALLAACAVALTLILGGRSAAAADPTVMVVLWFDTEDYILPADDDAAKRLCEILSARGIRGTFKVVGEKARTLERRGRADVIAALKKHDIAYHSDFHSVHPTPSEYLKECGWVDGVAEFVRREKNGTRDVRRIFGLDTLSAYGQPGSSFAPQTFAALAEIGIAPHGVPCYLDDGSHIGLNGKPFWFCGAITVYDMGPNVTRMDLWEEGALDEGNKKFQEIHDRLAREGGGLISIYYHPCEWVHRQFWDGVNFSRGANPPREEWKLPPQRTAEETEAAFQRFEKYVDFQKSLPGVKFITATDLPVVYPDRVRKEGLEQDSALRAVRVIARSGRIDFFALDERRSLSPADQFALAVTALARAIEDGKSPERFEVPLVLGPSESPPATEVDEVKWSDFRAAVLDARDQLRSRKQVPSPVFAGSKKIAPADFLVACARIAERELAHPQGPPAFPPVVPVPRGTALATEEHVAPDTPGLFGGWVIHPEGFRAPRIVEMTRLQAWTLKPAVREDPSANR
jgi:hypothetical protein